MGCGCRGDRPCEETADLLQTLGCFLREADRWRGSLVGGNPEGASALQIRIPLSVFDALPLRQSRNRRLRLLVEPPERRPAIHGGVRRNYDSSLDRASRQDGEAVPKRNRARACVEVHEPL